jgi:NitT/TauT family transport system permease protein
MSDRIKTGYLKNQGAVPASDANMPVFDQLFDLALRLLPHLALFIAIIAVWEIAVATQLITSIIIPRPSAIGGAIVELYITKGTIYRHFIVTFSESVLGFCIGAAIAVGLAVCSALVESFRRYVIPYAVVLNVTPGIALTPVIIAWFGYGMGSKIALAAIISFFPIFVNTLTGLTQFDEDREELFRSLGASKVQVFAKLRVPAALPLLFAGLKIGLTTALIGAVVAEFAQATDGVGVLMSRFSFQLNMAASLATLLSMTAIGLILFYSMEFIDDRIVFWRRESRREEKSRARAKAWKKRASK